MSDFQTILGGMAVLTPVIIGVVSWLRRLIPSVPSNAVPLLAMLVGVSVVLYIEYLLPIPVWRTVGVGLALGAGASGIVNISQVFGVDGFAKSRK